MNRTKLLRIQELMNVKAFKALKEKLMNLLIKQGDVHIREV